MSSSSSAFKMELSYSPRFLECLQCRREKEEEGGGGEGRVLTYTQTT